MKDQLINANSSPLIALERAGYQHLFSALFSQILIPPAVRSEVFGSNPSRRLAISLGLPVIGTLGILLRSKDRGLISEIRPIMEVLQNQGFHISERLFEGITQASGEVIRSRN